ncbi:ornithine--oxo-acid transaminase [Nocardioides sp. GY 10113]|uniref:ornithine--oxo-acid transaminase n=1 Tax=Nocardioides sp. GY 10113 TaxID=2569761 RepID=UPI0010A8EE06|nr:ornithine--oxo-acid transaminase [Nocardioides sp. GY 10113]TIC85982.1 ornithine--oxo-acid transaminase [Nocardioides sp. GY 10113]
MIPTAPTSTPEAVERAEARTAHNYHPLPVVIEHAEGAWMTDVDGRRFLDLLAGYSALNFGHSNPRLVEVAREQLGRLTLTSRAFIHDHFADFCAGLGDLCGKDLVLPMNTGAEAVETAIKVSRKWGYEVKGVADDRARIIVAAGNFHGRTTTIVGFSDDPDARNGFGPFTPGFDMVPYGDLAALEAAITPDTVAVLIEPIQGEGGVVIPPEGYLRGVREACTRHDVLFVADEIQAGLGRTGRTFACDHEGVVPDLYVLGKALGGGIVPVSAVVGDRDVLGVLRPGQHGSTFGGNPLACAVGTEVVRMLADGEPQARAAELGTLLRERLEAMVGRGVVGVRVRGLWAGVDIDPSIGTGREVCERLMARGVLAKDTHGSTIRLAPPLTISAEDLSWGLDQLEAVLAAERAA